MERVGGSGLITVWWGEGMRRGESVGVRKKHGLLVALMSRGLERCWAVRIERLMSRALRIGETLRWLLSMILGLTVFLLTPIVLLILRRMLNPSLGVSIPLALFGGLPLTPNRLLRSSVVASSSLGGRWWQLRRWKVASAGGRRCRGGRRRGDETVDDDQLSRGRCCRRQCTGCRVAGQLQNHLSSFPRSTYVDGWRGRSLDGG